MPERLSGKSVEWGTPLGAPLVLPSVILSYFWKSDTNQTLFSLPLLSIQPGPSTQSPDKGSSSDAEGGSDSHKTQSNIHRNGKGSIRILKLTPSDLKFSLIWFFA